MFFVIHTISTAKAVYIHVCVYKIYIHYSQGSPQAYSHEVYRKRYTVYINVIFTMKTGYIRSALITLGSFLFVITAVSAWTGPAGDPPNNNVAAPINVGATGQFKQGPLGINTNAVPAGAFKMTVGGDADIAGGLSADRLLVDGNSQFNGTVNVGAAGTNRQICLNGPCITAWPTGADNLGNHTATQNINMGGSQVTNLGNTVNPNDAATKAYVDSRVGASSGGSMCDTNNIANPVVTLCSANATIPECRQAGSRGANTLFVRHGAVYQTFVPAPGVGSFRYFQCWNGTLLGGF